MKHTKTKSQRVLGFVLALLLFCAAVPWLRAEELSVTDICFLAFRKCLSDTDLWTWISKGIIGQLIYCINGEAFCENYLAAVLK